MTHWGFVCEIVDLCQKTFSYNICMFYGMAWPHLKLDLLYSKIQSWTLKRQKIQIWHRCAFEPSVSLTASRYTTCRHAFCQQKKLTMRVSEEKSWKSWICRQTTGGQSHVNGSCTMRGGGTQWKPIFSGNSCLSVGTTGKMQATVRYYGHTSKERRKAFHCQMWGKALH